MSQKLLSILLCGPLRPPQKYRREAQFIAFALGADNFYLCHCYDQRLDSQINGFTFQFRIHSLVSAVNEVFLWQR